MAGGITFIPRQKSGMESFTENISPYLQMAMEFMLKKKLGEPEEKRKLSEEQRAVEKEKREAISGVSKGEIPITAIPESIRQSIMQGRSLDTTGLTGAPESLQAMQNISPTAQISGIPSFMQRIKPAETPESAQTRLMSSYAQQQQAINPYKALQGETLGAKQQINTLLENGTPWENIPIQLKIMAGFAAKEGGGLNFNFPSGTPMPQPSAELVEVSNLQGKRVKIKSSDLENALKQGYKR